MQITSKKEDYAEIVDMPRPEPQNHRRMPMIKRAAQFAPFAALTGFKEVLAQVEREHEASIEY
ncbi:hypothetical protein [Selenomonas ruminantium]|uniref:Uncharacterized protein n=1 Tax=Selenomonas ruminantium TaxID=971 RepID=A0A1H0UBG2_SELRU|nr:hypothetical protein [Selenomonas ruminantium]SDP63345.1 hypothetical protein SAMN05216366_13040 [Selenomonas ruminantium]